MRIVSSMTEHAKKGWQDFNSVMDSREAPSPGTMMFEKETFGHRQ